MSCLETPPACSAVALCFTCPTAISKVITRMVPCSSFISNQIAVQQPDCHLTALGCLSHAPAIRRLKSQNMPSWWQEGDVLYMPRGTVHQAVAQSSDAVHLTVSTYQRCTHGDLAVRLLNRALVSSEAASAVPLALRRGLPWGSLPAAGTRAKRKNGGGADAACVQSVAGGRAFVNLAKSADSYRCEAYSPSCTVCSTSTHYGVVSVVQLDILWLAHSHVRHSNAYVISGREEGVGFEKADVCNHS